MGSSTSQPRKGHDHPHHLPKVGSPDNMEWEHQEHRTNVFGSGPKLVVSLVVMMAVVTGFLIITL